MYIVLASKFIFNYLVSNYHLRRMKKCIELEDKYFKNNRKFLKYVNKFIYHASKCKKYQEKCDLIKDTMIEKYPILEES